MKRALLSHVVFAASLLALVALGSWWTVFISRAVELEQDARRATLENEARTSALVLGHEAAQPMPGLLGGAIPLEVLPSSLREPGDLSTLATPRHPEVAVRPVPAAVRAIEEKRQRRRHMVMGEGALLFLLLTVCSVMLWQLVVQEGRRRSDMEVFVSAMTHEMKTPLAGLKSLLQTLALGKVPEAMKPRLLALGLKEAEKLEHSIENALLAGHLRTERHGVRVERLSIRPLLEAFVDHRRRILVDRPDAIVLAWDLTTPDLLVKVDPDALRVILENLVDNAFKYGGESPVVTVRCRRETGVAVSVEDQGMGFEPRAAPDLFTPFHRFSVARKGAVHGTGLGLSISQALARKMGATLSASSPGPGRGATFTLTLEPAEPVPPESA